MNTPNTANTAYVNGENDDEVTADVVPSPIPLLRKDLREAAKNLTIPQVKYIVGCYYDWQLFRISSGNQAAALQRGQEPHLAIDWTIDRMVSLEADVKAMLDTWTRNEPTGLATWLRQIKGIGPVIAAGLCSHLDVAKPPETVGHWWRFSGLDSSVEWLGKEKAAKLVNTVVEGKSLTDDQVITIANILNRKPDRIRAAALRQGPGKPDLKAPTKTSLTNALAKRPWNASLRTLAYKVGESMVKVQNREGDFYGHLFAERKQKEWARNLRGEYAEQAKEKLATAKIGHDTDAYSWYSGQRAIKVPAGYRDGPHLLGVRGVDFTLEQVVVVGPAGNGVPMLPPAHIHARARRWTVKLLLAHLHAEAYVRAYGKEAPKPYVLTLPNHVHEIERPNPTRL